MSVKMKVNDLKEAVSGFNKIIGRSGSLPILECVKFTGQKSKVTIAATNLDEYLSYTCEVKNDKSFSFVMQLNDIKDILKGANRIGDIEFIQAEQIITASVKIGDNKINKNYTAMPVEDFPIRTAIATSTNIELSKSAFPKIVMTFQGTTKDDSRKVLFGVLLEKDTIVSTDGKHLTKFKEDINFKGRVILPDNKILKSLFFKEDAVLSLEEAKDDIIRNASIISGNWSYNFKPIEGNYPNYKQVIPNYKHAVSTISFDESSIQGIKQGIDLLEATKDNQKGLYLYAGSKGIQFLSGRETDFQTTIIAKGSLSLKEPDIVVMINKEILLKALRNGFTTFNIIDNISPICITDKSNDLLLVMPIKGSHYENNIEELINKLPQGKEKVTMNESTNNQQNEFPVNQENVITEKNEVKTNEVPNIEGKTPSLGDEKYDVKNQNTPFPKAIEIDSFDGLIEVNNEIKTMAKAILDKSVLFGKDLREFKRGQKTKEKNFQEARKLITQLQASGF